VRGFWGDVVNSPYISFGIYCETPNEFAKDLYKILNKGTGAAQHRHHTVEISIYNILSFLYEMENGRIYEMRKKHDIYSGLGVKDKDETEEDGVVIVEEEVEDEKEPDEERTRNIECAFDGVVVHLLSGT
jgi:dynein assembly factor 3, axonemal